jgi:hypothetical protein
MAAAAVGVAGLLFLPESYAPVILKRKVYMAKGRRPDAQLYSVLDFEEHPGTVGYLVNKFARPGMTEDPIPTLQWPMSNVSSCLSCPRSRPISLLALLLLVIRCPVPGHGYCKPRRISRSSTAF